MRGNSEDRTGDGNNKRRGKQSGNMREGLEEIGEKGKERKGMEKRGMGGLRGERGQGTWKRERRKGERKARNEKEERIGRRIKKEDIEGEERIAERERFC